MATAKIAHVLRTECLGPETRLLELLALEPLGYCGGQYVIVDSGRVLANGKAAKRAYSLLSADADQSRFQLVVKRLPGGLGSGFLHEIEVGSEVRFSGPWGKLFPEAGASGPSLVLATDTGISATLGLVRGAHFAALLPQTRFIWLRTSEEYFVSDAFVRARVPSSCGEVSIQALPPIGHPERVAYVRALVARLLAASAVERGFIAGDGSVNYALLDDLVAAGIPATRDSVESFFNMPKKSA